MNIKQIFKDKVKEVCNITYPDPEFQDAVMELRDAYGMLNNASNDYRRDEATYRILAARLRLAAILYERNEDIDTRDVRRSNRPTH